MIRVLIVDDQGFVRQTSKSLLTQHEPDWKLFEAAYGKLAVDRMDECAHIQAPRKLNPTSRRLNSGIHLCRPI